jgi:hypothetical protein
MHMTRTQVEDVLKRHSIYRALIVEDCVRHIVSLYLPLPISTKVIAELDEGRHMSVEFQINVLPWWKTFGKGRFIWRIKQ